MRPIVERACSVKIKPYPNGSCLLMVYFSTYHIDRFCADMETAQELREEYLSAE